jgi:hypothetical protein
MHPFILKIDPFKMKGFFFLVESMYTDVKIFFTAPVACFAPNFNYAALPGI